MKPPLRRILLALGVTLLTGEAAVRIAAAFMPGIRYLAETRVRSRPPRYASLDAFLKAQTANLIPHRPWRNSFNNAQGFNDAEFEIPKPPGRYRVVALGDSFCYSMAPYPDAAQTLVERQLGGRCGPDFDLLNAGFAGASPWEYRTLLDLMLPLWRPDAVVVHFYLGNDGPDLFTHRSDMPVRKEPLFHSFFVTYVRNAVKLLRSREAPPTAPDPPRSGRSRVAARGGETVDPALPPLTDADPTMAGPLFSAEAFRKIMADELGRLYVPEGGQERDWELILAALEDMRLAAKRAGVRFLMVLYPSRLQVYPDFRDEMLAAVQAQRGYRRLAAERIDPLAPNRFLLAWCARSGVECFDLTPQLIQDARRHPEPLYIERDSHWNILGNRLAAAAEAAFLERELCRGQAARAGGGN